MLRIDLEMKDPSTYAKYEPILLKGISNQWIKESDGHFRFEENPYYEMCAGMCACDDLMDLPEFRKEVKSFHYIVDDDDTDIIEGTLEYEEKYGK